MPWWKECSVTEERLCFVARLLDGEGMSEVCRDFGISRKTGYKIFNRDRDQELEALTDRSRRPVRQAALPFANHPSPMSKRSPDGAPRNPGSGREAGGPIPISLCLIRATNKSTARAGFAAAAECRI
jgi:hypothetical protein